MNVNNLTLSAIIPVHNEADNVPVLIDEIAELAAKVPLADVIFVDDGSIDDTLAVLTGLKERYPFLRVIKHDVRAGQSAAMRSGAETAQGELIVFLDGDGQNNPADIEKLFEAYKQAAKEQVMIAGQREKREDNFIRRLSSRLANRIRSSLLKDGTRDTGCSLKLFKRSDYLKFPYFNHMHRFLPALAARENLKIIHIDVSHRPRTRGISKYGFWDRLRAGICDLLGVLWLKHRGLPDKFSYREV